MISEKSIKEILMAFADSGSSASNDVLNELAQSSNKKLEEILLIYEDCKVESDDKLLPTGFVG